MKNEKINIIKRAAYGSIQLIIKHYAALSAFTAFTFTLVCISFSRAYLSEFSISIFSFANVSDVYQIALSNGVLNLSFLLSALITLILVFFAKATVLMFSEDTGIEIKGTILKTTQLKGIVLTVFAIAGTIFIVPYFINNNAEASSNIHKYGFVPRYNIYTNQPVYKCYSVIGTSSDYLFTWSYDKKQPVIISKPTIKHMNQIVPNIPENSISVRLSRYPPTRPSQGRLTTLSRIEKEWSDTLNSECGQTVEWANFAALLK